MQKIKSRESCLVTGKNFSISLGLVFELDHISLYIYPEQNLPTECYIEEPSKPPFK